MKLVDPNRVDNLTHSGPSRPCKGFTGGLECQLLDLEDVQNHVPVQPSKEEEDLQEGWLSKMTHFAATKGTCTASEVAS